jgi:ABC-2 type transport system ATP-binding protein
MNIMTGYLGATDGKVLVNGHDILTEPEEAKKCIGYLPELPPLYMEMTVREYLEFAAELKKIPKNEREGQLENVIRLVKLRDVENRLIQNLSKGYKQRVGLAQAILGFPEIIILDEPTVGLDPKQIIEIRALIRELAENHTIILSSHILAEVREVCDYILIIANGKLVASDTPENLEHLIGGEGYVEIQTRVDEETVKAVLASIPEVAGATYKTESGLLTAQIKSRGNEDIREKIFFAFAEQKLPLLSLTMSKTTLEEVFLELTQGNTTENIRKLRTLEQKKGSTVEAEEETEYDVEMEYDTEFEEEYDVEANYDVETDEEYGTEVEYDAESEVDADGSDL